MLRSRLAVIAALTLAARAASAQVTIEKVLVKVDNDVVTALDLRQARLLKLVSVQADTDSAIVEALIDRRLVLAEAAHFAPPEPTPAAIAARRGQWESVLGSGANFGALLSRAGMTDAGLQAWWRDELRIQAYLDRRFAALPAPSRDELLRYYREHEADYTQAGVLKPFDDVEVDVRARLVARARAAGIASWIAELRRRADIQYR